MEYYLMIYSDHYPIFTFFDLNINNCPLYTPKIISNKIKIHGKIILY